MYKKIRIVSPSAARSLRVVRSERALYVMHSSTRTRNLQINLPYESLLPFLHFVLARLVTLSFARHVSFLTSICSRFLPPPPILPLYLLRCIPVAFRIVLS